MSLESERQALHTRLLDAVRACQTHLGGRSELATESSSWVSCLCTQFEAVLQHQLKQPTKSLSMSAFKQVTARTISEDITFWEFVKSHLTKHETERFETLSNVTSDIGKGRAWLRNALNEHSLDRYFHILLSDVTLLRTFYETESFMMDEEKSSTLPQMAAGLSSIYFNIKFDDSSLNGSTKPLASQHIGFIPNLIEATSNIISRDEKLVNDSFPEAHCAEKPKKRTGKKKRAKIISFGDDNAWDGPVTPANKGGPGFVVMKPPVLKSDVSATSESSSGVFSNDGSDHRLKSDNLEDLNKQEQSTNILAPDKSARTVDESINRPTTLLSKMSLKSKEESKASGRLKTLHNESSSSVKVTPVSRQADSVAKDNIDPDEIGDVTRHLMSVRQRSILGSHDLVMDDWSVRSNSVSGGAFTPDAVGGEVHPMQDEYDTQSTGSKSDLAPHDSANSPASFTLSLAQKSSNNWRRNVTDTKMPDTVNKESMSEDELRQALIALMHRNDELTEINRSTRSLLEGEMEHSAALRIEIEQLQKVQKQQNEELTTQQQQHIRENEVLRNQLKKYVNAVQALQRGDTNVEMPTELPRTSNDSATSNVDADAYEKKLIEVAEMHGELMEFNERLHVRMQSAISLLHHMKNELVDLRGPMPNDDLVNRIESDNLSGNLEHSPPLSRALINIWIPSLFLKGKGANAHHLFQVFVRIADEEWNVYRRYSQFHDLHLQLRKKYPILETFGFPPKKVMGNKSKKFVEDRRKGLQLYLRLLMNNVVQNHEKIVARPIKDTLTSLLPFFSENLDETNPKSDKKSRRRNE